MNEDTINGKSQSTGSSFRHLRYVTSFVPEKLIHVVLVTHITTYRSSITIILHTVKHTTRRTQFLYVQ